MKNIRYLFLLVSFLFTHGAYAQATLSLQEAINIALQKSLDIQIAQAGVEISSINNHKGVAGALPTVTLSANDNESITSVNQKLSNGNNISRNAASSNNLNMSLQVTMVLYNNMRIVTTQKRLAEIEKLNQEQLRDQIQNTIANVMVKYYDIVRQDSYLKTLDKTIEVANNRYSILKARKEVGLSNDAELFQAKIDINTRTQEKQAQQLILQQSIADLLNLLNLNPDSTITIRDTIVPDVHLKLDSVMSSLIRSPQMIAAAQQVSINQLIEKEVAAQRYPTIRLNSGYNYNRNQSAAGLFLLNQSYGPFIGLNVQVPIFNGTAFKRQEQVAGINTKIAQYQQESLLNNFETNAVKTYQAYKNVLARLETEKENFALASSLLDLMLKKFELNNATIIDLRESQRSYEEAGYRLINLSYAAKMAEIELKRLTGSLMN